MIVKREFPSSSSSAVYVAAIDDATGASSCNCKGWTFKREGKPRGCKHTHALEAEFGFIIANGVPVSAAKLASKLAAKPSPGKAPVVPKVKATGPAFEAAQAAVEAEVAKVKGKRSLDFDDDPEPAATQATAGQAGPSATGTDDQAQAVATADPGASQASTPPAILPMLASALKEDQSLEDLTGAEWVMEEKYDGHRLMVRVFAAGAGHGPAQGWSRPGREKPALLRALPPAIEREVSQMPAGLYDGELYVPGGTSSDVSRLDRAGDLRLALFDVVELMGMDATKQPYSQRRALLALAFQHIEDASTVRMSEAGPVSLERLHGIWNCGGEGAICKRVDSPYRSGWRSPDWVKLKRQDAAELTVTGFKPGKNGPNAIACLRHDDGRETTVKVLDNETLRAITEDPAAFVGRRLTISYRGLTVSGMFRHPMWDHLL